MQDLMTRADTSCGMSRWRGARATLGSETAVDSTRPILIWEPRRVVPSYAVPVADIRARLSPAAAQADDVPGLLHPGIPFAVHTASGSPVSVGDRAGAGFRFADDDLAGYVELDFDAFDDWYEEDERIAGHPRSPFHSIHVHRSSRPVRIEVDGQLVAETTRARLLSETSLPLRFYLPLEDVHAELHRSSTRTYCPHKGEASYWSLDAGGAPARGPGLDLRATAAGGRRDPGARGLLGRAHRRVLRRRAPRAGHGAPFADALRDEFGVPTTSTPTTAGSR